MKISKILSSSFLALAVLVFGVVNSANAAEITGYKNATVRWNGVVNAESYNIYYKEKSDTNYIHSVRSLPKESREYTIGYLKNNGSYVYKLCALNGSNAEFWCSQPMVLGKGTVVATRVVAQAAAPTKEIVVASEPKVVANHDQATLTWNFNPKAEHFYIYYKKLGEQKWTHSVIGLNYGSTQYTIKYLDKVTYEYQIVALDGNYKPIEESSVSRLNQVPMRL